MRTQRHYAGNQATGILRAPERPPQKEGAGSQAQDAPAHDEGLRGTSMPTLEQISKELLEAMKRKDTVRTSTLRMLIAALRNKEIEKKKTLAEGEVLEVIQVEAKRRKEAIEEYTKAVRADLASK